ncbi:hypothetical protein Poli38472_006597 [Pythium oligandrum]|uniref:Uncharacterized protein n=1 Tax=Pythium oligandrum TaxID=41045 RepID=A0A8K1C4X0_PYTOL|nr:hypothetical protein Poli38472_006597 [Pythium oligandrum]|eukprot:TMW56587.1 hypothetical protein Poli38472_006597 [Pythium oligandrum]
MKDSRALASTISIDNRCFGSNFLTDLLGKVLNLPSLSTRELNALQCKRCCYKYPTLFGWDYDTSCPQRKIWWSAPCSLECCEDMDPSTAITATVKLTASVTTANTAVVAGLSTPVKLDGKTVHQIITCTSFTAGCTYTHKLSELFVRSNSWGASVASKYKVTDYVTWRYTVGVENWKPWNDADKLTFKDAETVVYVEAWTPCGRAFQDSFKVVLHPHASHNACADFPAMWVENTAKPRTVASHVCAYPQSDFVLMSFKFDSDNCKPQEASTVKGAYTDVRCFVTLAESGALDKVKEVALPLTVTPDASTGRIQLSKQFALELVHELTTASITDVRVRCDFKYTHYKATSFEMEPCSYSFSITDCDPPEVETKGQEAVCKASECLDSSGIPGPFEACKGTVFTTTSSPSLATVVKTLTGQCCAQCSKLLTCAAVPETIGTSGVMRCTPPKAVAVLIMHKAHEPVNDPQFFLLLAVVSAMLAVLALLVLKHRRRNASAPKEPIDDMQMPRLTADIL